MCRFFALRSDGPVDPVPWIASFAERCRVSKEYQGHGWGVSWWDGEGWQRHRSVRPIWEEVPEELPSATIVLVHARSAFRNEGIVVENNMPFVADDMAFAFNGELRGVRLSVPGETGAAKLFELLRRFRAADGNTEGALRRLDRVVTARTEYVRALNTVVSDGRDVWASSRYSEDPEYFTLWQAWLPLLAGGTSAVSSEPLDVDGQRPEWDPMPHGEILKIDRETTCS
ncbi:MAG: class II glutamine amidotransferase [Gemmatimonadota bacterium]|nr:class II glutamine amidotransferase [Gemmatimonadota bacterium]